MFFGIFFFVDIFIDKVILNLLFSFSAKIMGISGKMNKRFNIEKIRIYLYEIKMIYQRNFGLG